VNPIESIINYATAHRIFNVNSISYISEHNVSRLTSYKYSYNAETRKYDKQEEIETDFYDVSGRITNDEILYPDGGSLKREYIYDIQGSPIESDYVESDDSRVRISTWDNQYDTNGRLIQRITNSSDQNGFSTTETFTYDDNNNIVDFESISKAAKSDKGSTVIWTFVYNKDNLIDRIQLSSSTRLEYKYDKNNRLIKCYYIVGSKEGEIKTQDFECKYLFDKKNQLSKINVQTILKDQIIFNFNENGLLEEYERRGMDKTLFAYQFRSESKNNSLPDDTDLYLRGHTEFVNKNISVAKNVINEYITKYPNGEEISNAYFDMGFILLVEVNFFTSQTTIWQEEEAGVSVLEAIEYFDKSIEKDPQQGGAYWLRGECNYVMSDFADKDKRAKVLHDYETAISIDKRYEELIGDRLNEVKEDMK